MVFHRVKSPVLIICCLHVCCSFIICNIWILQISRSKNLCVTYKWKSPYAISFNSKLYPFHIYGLFQSLFRPSKGGSQGYFLASSTVPWYQVSHQGCIKGLETLQRFILTKHRTNCFIACKMKIELPIWMNGYLKFNSLY